MAVALDVASALAVASLLAGVVLWTARRLEPAGAGPGPEEPIGRVAAAVPPGPAAVALGVILVLLTAGGCVAVAADIDSRLLRVNVEQSVASLYSALLLYAAGSLAFFCSRADEHGRRTGWLVLAVALAYVGFDEAAELHERVEVRTGLPAPVVLAPVAAAALYGWLRTLEPMRAARPALALFAAGGAAWAVSQALDPFHSSYKSVVEEALELAGSSLILVALLIVARRLGSRPRRTA